MSNPGAAMADQLPRTNECYRQAAKERGFPECHRVPLDDRWSKAVTSGEGDEQMKMSLMVWAVAAAVVIAPACKKRAPIALAPAPQSTPLPPPVIAEPPRPAPAPSVAVAEPRPAPVLNMTPAAVPKKSIAERLAGEVVDAYFDFDKSFIRPDANFALTRNADALKRILIDFENTTIIIEGHCDERGSAEYNIGLGDRRGNASKDFLAGLGVDSKRFMVVSYGKERPQCTESNEDCWQRNRRVHFVPGETQRLRTE